MPTMIDEDILDRLIAERERYERQSERTRQLEYQRDVLLKDNENLRRSLAEAERAVRAAMEGHLT